MLDPIQKYYNQVRTNYNINSLRRRKILKLVGQNQLAHKRILDIGCASGYLIKALKQKNNFVAGVDIAERFFEQLSKELDQFFILNVEKDVWPQDFLDNKFDLIICAEIIEHLFDQDNFLLRLKEILKPGGQVLISTPNFLVWNNRLRMLFGQYGLKEILFDEGHIRLLSYNGLRAKIKKCGFKIIKEDDIWYPNNLEMIKKILSPNLFVYQSIIMITPYESNY